MKAQGSRGSVPLAPVPLMARLRFGSVSPWHRIGWVRRLEGGLEGSIDNAAATVAPAWWARTRKSQDKGAVVEFGAVVDGVVVTIGHSSISSRVLFESCRMAPREPAPRLRDWRSGAPAPLRSGFPDASRVSARRRAA